MPNENPKEFIAGPFSVLRINHVDGRFVCDESGDLPPHDFTDEEKKSLHTYVQFGLPFALHDLATSIYPMESKYDVIVETRRYALARVNNALLSDGIEPALQLGPIDGRPMIFPDTRGIMHTTALTFVFREYLEFDWPKHTIVARAVRAANELIDAYCLNKHSYAIRHIVASDIIKYNIGYGPPINVPGKGRFLMSEIIDDSIRYRTVPLPFVKLLKSDLPVHGDDGFQQSVSKFLSPYTEPVYKFAYTLYVQAAREAHVLDNRSAYVTLGTCIDVAASLYIRSRKSLNDKNQAPLKFAELRRKFPKIRAANLKKIEDLNLQTAIGFLNILLPAKKAIPPEIIAECEHIRNERNYAVHEPGSFTGEVTHERLVNVRAFLHHLLKNHDDGVSR